MLLDIFISREAWPQKERDCLLAPPPRVKSPWSKGCERPPQLGPKLPCLQIQTQVENVTS